MTLARLLPRFHAIQPQNLFRPLPDKALIMMTKPSIFTLLVLSAGLLTAAGGQSAKSTSSNSASGLAYPLQEGFVDSHGMMIYYYMVGRGEPLLILHGGPGGSHEELLPFLLPLALHNKLVFIDERGSGRSARLQDPSGYTVNNMTEDVEAVRHALGLGKMSILGHSFGGLLAQTYALKYQRNLSHLILVDSFSSVSALNSSLARVKGSLPPEERARIDKYESEGLFDHGKDYEKNRYPDGYLAVTSEVFFPYIYHNHPDANFDPMAHGNENEWYISRAMWGEHGEFVIDGNLKSAEYTDRLPTIKVPTLILVGDHDAFDPSLSQTIHEKITGSKLVIFPNTGHRSFEDRNDLFIQDVEKFLH
jgi:proline iminopeptidase